MRGMVSAQALGLGVSESTKSEPNNSGRLYRVNNDLHGRYERVRITPRLGYFLSTLSRKGARPWRAFSLFEGRLLLPG
jgi:hypothetical protein